MWYPRQKFSPWLGCAVVYFTVAIVGCGDFCITGFSVNGTGGVNVKVGNPPPPCSLPHVNGMVRTVALKTPACAGCPTARRAEHIFVTLESIELRPAPADENSAAVWLEIAPQLASEPHQIDLLDGSGPELLAENASVPAGSYREVRLQFLPDTIAGAERFPAENRCGGTGWNCIVMASGWVEPFRFPGGVPELFLPIQQAASNSFLVLPDSKTELRLSFEPRLVPYLSETEGWKWQFILSGSATTEPQEPVEPQISSGH